jgi:HEAT repeat protein
MAASALGDLGDKRAVEPLIRTLQDNNDNVCLAVVCALEAIKDPRAVNPLIRELENKNQELANRSAVALVALADPEGLIAVIKYMENMVEIKKYPLEELKKMSTHELMMIINRIGELLSRKE